MKGSHQTARSRAMPTGRSRGQALGEQQPAEPPAQPSARLPLGWAAPNRETLHAEEMHRIQVHLRQPSSYLHAFESGRDGFPLKVI